MPHVVYVNDHAQSHLHHRRLHAANPLPPIPLHSVSARCYRSTCTGVGERSSSRTASRNRPLHAAVPLLAEAAGRDAVAHAALNYQRLSCHAAARVTARMTCALVRGESRCLRDGAREHSSVYTVRARREATQNSPTRCIYK